MKVFTLTVSVILFFVAVFFGFKVITKAKETQVLKVDYAEINHFKYGLFSVNEWKRRITDIVSAEVENITLTKESEKAFKKQLQSQLAVFIDKVIERIKASHYDTASGQFKLGVFNSLVDVKEVKRGIPGYADAILAELRKSKTQSEIKDLLKEKIDDYISKTFDAFDDSARMKILQKTKSSTIEEAKAKLDTMIDLNQKEIKKYALFLMITAVIIFLLEGFKKGPMEQVPYFILILTLLILLITGVTTPMIDMEAKITTFKFILLEHPVEFTNQVLYFQSKSIQNVFWIMITHHDIEMKLVGILMVCFSIVFPVFKMLSSLAYFYDYCRAREYKIVQFFVMKSGKWSMADVLVVAIFMAYIGFNGILNTQMEDLSSAAESLNVIATNGTNLQPGFYLFLTYTILAMFLSGFLKSRPYICHKENTASQRA
jgi:hypothetical protein